VAVQFSEILIRLLTQKMQFIYM